MAQFLLKMTLEQRDPCDGSLPNLGDTLQRWQIRLQPIVIQHYRSTELFHVLTSEETIPGEKGRRNQT